MKQYFSNSKSGCRGGVLVTFTLLLIPLIGVAALAVDFGNLYRNWRAMQLATDAAVLNGALVMGESRSEILARAATMEIATSNGLLENSDFIASNDIEFGFWNDVAKNFSPGISPLNAVRMQAQRNVGTTLAHLVGLQSFFPAVESVALLTTAGSPRCVSPFGLESFNFPEELGIGTVPLTHEFETPHVFTVGKNSPGNWGKIDIPDSMGSPINMSSNPNFCSAMLQEECWLSPDLDFDPCASALGFGDDQLGEQYDGATGAAGVKPVLLELIGEEIVMLVNSPFSNGKKPVDVYGYAVGMITSVNGNGANLQIGVEVTELRTDVPLIEGGSNVIRYLVK